MPNLSLSQPTALAISIAMAIVAGSIRGFSGFGGPAVMSLVLTQYYAPLSVLPKVIVIDALSNVKLVPSTWHEVDWRMAAPVTVGALIGAPLGLYALLVVDPVVAKRAIGAITAACTIVMLTGWRLERMPALAVRVAVGLFAGIALGATYIALIVVLFFLASPVAAATSRANTVLWGLVLGTALIAGHWVAGTIDLGGMWRSILVGVVYLGATALGARLFRASSEAVFRRAVLWLLLALSAIGLVT